MGNYVNVRAKKDCADLINDMWHSHFKDGSWLVYSKSVIQKEIDYIQSGKAPSQAHLIPYLHTVEDWNDMFPAFKEGNGQVFIGATGAEIPPEEAEVLRMKVQFVIDNRFLFTQVTGLRDAREELEMAIPFDCLDEHGKPQVYEEVTFAQLPVTPQSGVYRLCLEYDRPDLWAAFTDYSAKPSEETWNVLRHKVVPWSGRRFGDTVWQLCERIAEERDGQSLGLMGRFRDGNIPSEFEVRKALEGVR